MGIFYDGQAVFSADTVRYFTKLSQLGFGIIVFSTVDKGHGIKAEMIVNMVFIKVGGDNNLKAITSHFFRQLQADLVRLFGCNLVRIKALITVPSDISVIFSVLLFG